MDIRIKQIIHALVSVRNKGNESMVNEAICNCRCLDLDYDDVDEEKQKETFYDKSVRQQKM